MNHTQLVTVISELVAIRERMKDDELRDDVTLLIKTCMRELADMVPVYTPPSFKKYASDSMAESIRGMIET